MGVRAKFVCEEIEAGDDGSGDVKLSAVVSGSEENRNFFKWTPSGTLRMGTCNAEALSQFELGKDYYIDITPAAEPAADVDEAAAAAEPS